MKILVKAISGLTMAAVLATSVHAEDSELMAKFGGREQLQKMTDEFVDVLFGDPRIKEKFAHADAGKLKVLLGLQFCQLIDNSCPYPGKDMRTAHTGREISNADFNALAEDLQIVFAKHGVPFAAQNKLVAKLAPMQRDVVTK